MRESEPSVDGALGGGQRVRNWLQGQTPLPREDPAFAQSFSLRSVKLRIRQRNRGSKFQMLNYKTT